MKCTSANCRRVHVFCKGILGSVSSRTVRHSFHISQMIGCNITHSSNFGFLILVDVFVSNEVREWAGVRGIGLLTAPGEFHGLTADLENVILVVKLLTKKLADDHPKLTQASCVSLACSSHNSRLQEWRILASPWASGQTMRCTVSQKRCPLRLRLSRYPR